jgi:hypothetical protein
MLGNEAHEARRLELLERRRRAFAYDRGLRSVW